MKKQKKETSDLSKEQEKIVHISSEMIRQRGMMESRLGMNAANDIANLELMQLIKQHDLYRFGFCETKGDFTKNWNEYCQLMMQESASEIDVQIEKLPIYVRGFELLYKNNPMVLELLNIYRKTHQKITKLSAMSDT